MQNTTPTTNFGTDLLWQVGSTAGKSPTINRGIILFPALTPSIPFGTLLSVNLFFRQSSGALETSPCGVHNVTGQGINFNENFVTWDDFDLGSAWASGGGDFDDVERLNFTLNDIGSRNFNLDALAMWNTQIVTRGQTVFTVILKRDSETFDDSTASFDSSEAVSPSNRPLLTLTHAFATGGLIPVLD